MKTTIAKWGNSLAIRIPKPFAEQVGIGQGKEVELTLEKEQIVVSRPQCTLSELLAGVTPKNIHEEIDTGYPIGNEAW